MLTLTSLLFAVTIAGAFWVGVLAARRLRDWGDGRRALEEAEQGPLMLLPAGAAVVPTDDASERVRAAVAEHLASGPDGAPAVVARDLLTEGRGELGLSSLRVGDVIVVDAAEPDLDGDYLVEGWCVLRDGAATSYVVVMVDGDRSRWVVGAPEEPRWLVLSEVSGHGLRGEPPRQIRLGAERQFSLERRMQASVAGVGRHGRPVGTRVATYTYRGSMRDMLWLERWGDEVLAGEGRALPAHAFSFLPGS